MSAVPRSGRVYARLTCGEKTCCTRGQVPVTGAEISRICQTLAIDPTDFLATVPSTADDPTAFAVHNGRRLSARLLTDAHGCVFLLRTNSGAGRCGLGDLAPAPCRADLAQVLDAAATDLDEWHDVVSKWNDYAGPEGVDASVDDFLRYVLDVYAEMRAGAVWRGNRDEATGT